ncbi:hypothetical protein GAP32_056 [Cronobacter phage vB_CsaM_GAP32]|uniref:Uncharacterized protein n=1 Tax=Cronobacter phage vB_CsaM_GAP32 TaxID=1141136 RepID=K4FB05_9CAUD|nr:hypothetical protein GAP32_056 [Cronobacter phage vB_CsaM_GAP32]AFC21504.1 hypothetical protein GAP32_056 [Cronobacter phage vB_CsaM_GAP32]
MNTDIIIKMLKLMERAERVEKSIDSSELMLSKELAGFENHYDISFDKGNRIICHFWYMNDGDKFWRSHEIFKISFSDIDASSNIHTYCLTYSPLNKSCSVHGVQHFKIVEPYEFDEALYFQKLTQHNLPDEQDYIDACEILKSIWKGNFVYLYLNFHELETHIKHVENLILQSESLHA